MKGNEIALQFCDVFRHTKSFWGTHIYKLIASLILSLTLFIYISKLKFTYEDFDLPWNRQTFLKYKMDVLKFYNNNLKEKRDCNKYLTYCVSNDDCKNLCTINEFQCVNQECIIPYDKNSKINCNKRKGGIMMKSITNEEVCICTRPLFYNGKNCDEVNVNITENGINISSKYDALINKESINFLICKDPSQIPVKLNHSFTCVPPLLQKIIHNLYLVTH